LEETNVQVWMQTRMEHNEPMYQCI